MKPKNKAVGNSSIVYKLKEDDGQDNDSKEDVDDSSEDVRLAYLFYLHTYIQEIHTYCQIKRWKNVVHFNDNFSEKCCVAKTFFRSIDIYIFKEIN
jgi:hypothetical protein